MDGGAGAHRVAEQDDRQTGVLAAACRCAQRASGTGEGSCPTPSVPTPYAEPQQPQGDPGRVDVGFSIESAWPAVRRNEALLGPTASSPDFAPPCSITTMPRAGSRRGPCGRVRERACVTPFVPGQCDQRSEGSNDRIGPARYPSQRHSTPVTPARQDGPVSETDTQTEADTGVEGRARRPDPRDRRPVRPPSGAPGAGRGGRGRALALLRPRRPDPGRQRLRQEAAPRGARGRGPRSPHA